MMLRDDLYWLATTVLQEAGGEPWDGQLAVAWVIVNRVRQHGSSVSDTVLAPYQFSCWNTTSPTKRNLDLAEDATEWHNAYSAACAAYFGLRADPTAGATFYCRTDLDPKPAWFVQGTITAAIGHHSFVRAPA